MSAFETIILAAKTAQAQFSVLHGKQEDNVEVIQELADVFMAELQQLVWAAGGNNDALTPIVEGIRNDIALCFFERRYPESLFAGEPAALQSAVIVRGVNLHSIAAE